MSGWKLHHKAIDLTGARHGIMTVASPTRVNGALRWVCQCDCGNTRIVSSVNWRRGDHASCGCQRYTAASASLQQHGHNRGGRRTKEYRTWANMVGRCRNARDKSFASYGGRGITVSDSWAASFEAFLADMGNAPSPSHSIDRIDNDKGYEAGNCRWATKHEQARNTRRTIKINGRCLKDECEAKGLKYGAVQARIRRGVPIELALSPLEGHAFRALLRSYNVR